MGKNLLYKTKCYLIGAMESCEDTGSDWRNIILDQLKDLNINFLNPLDKHFVEDVQESKNLQLELKQWRENGEYDRVAEKMKVIRRFDLSCVDKSDFVIFHYDNNKSSCGSYEEIFRAISIKRSIFIISKNGIKTIPLWLFGCLPYKYFYNSIEECVEMIKMLDRGEKIMDSDRWRLLKPEYR